MENVKVKRSLDHRKGRKVFLKLGTCSRTFAYILNREFNNPRELEEKAVNPLAGGIYQLGYQCGMLWGASLAIGTEAYRRCENTDQAIAVSIKATQDIMRSFAKNEHTVNCREVTHCDFSNKWSYAKYMLTGRFLHCFNMAKRWAPEAIDTAIKSLEDQKVNYSLKPRSCASELVKQMGGSEEEMVMVAGFAGGMGLSGNGCGALSAAIWMKAKEYHRTHDDENAFLNPEFEKVVNVFKSMSPKATCIEITKERFTSIDAHTSFINKGGCSSLISILSYS